MAKLGVQDRYVDAFCGRVPRSILARHYADYSPERLREIYEEANLRLLKLQSTTERPETIREVDEKGVLRVLSRPQTDAPSEGHSYTQLVSPVNTQT